MLTSLALVFLAGLAMAAICQWIKLPRIIGMLLTGILLGPYALNLLDPVLVGIPGESQGISPDLRQIALIIILIKAGLSLDLKDLKRVGRPAIMMSFVPASFELIAFVLLGPVFLGITPLEGAVMGSVLAAVSPAVVVPRMVHLMDHHYGTKKSIPQMILAGASCDDVFIIVLFSTFSGMAAGGTVQWTDFLNIPISIILGIILGALVGYLLAGFFETAYTKHHHIRNSTKVVVVMGVAFMLMAIEVWAKPHVAISGLLAVVAMACMLKIRCVSSVSKRLSEKFGKLWIAAEVILFVLVGAAVNIEYTMKAGLAAIAMIFVALAFRALGVCCCLLFTKISAKERLFCIIAYLPKATVQAAIGSVPMAMGLGCGEIVLSVAVLAILITAPLGAIGMDLTYKKLLTKDEPPAVPAAVE